MRRRALLSAAIQLSVSLALSFDAAAQAPAVSLLPPIPALRLSLPAALTLVGARREGAPLWSEYWRSGSVPREWRGVPDSELRLELPTGHWELGRLSLSTELSTVPGRERDCEPDCRGPGWSSALRLKYDTGDAGPLRETGPELKLLMTPPRAGSPARGLLQGAFSGKF